MLSGVYIAHRGLHDILPNTPENSLAAFRTASDKGLTIEIDIHLTKDGRVVVFHDSNIRRMCGIDGIIEKMTLDELKKYTLAGTEERIPTLEECLAAVSGKVPLLIEFKCTKGSGAPLCVAADKILSEYQGKYIVQSFYPPILLWYRRNRRYICRGQLSSPFRGEPFVKKMLSCLLFNFMSRPDFISYEFTGANSFCRKLCVKLGAFSVGWTFRRQSDVDNLRKEFDTYIFENFLPSEIR
ncbi:MAG: glycerophosphodiester phosphodiesterase family protein [Clostridia bacterium]|nr:glycerophosphodiester phosphodiesterase family protein [Clostridia bacterium]